MFRIETGDCRQVVETLEARSIEAVVTDPPYGLTETRSAQTGQWGCRWDATRIEQDVSWWRQVRRVVKPGGHLVAFSSPRTYHRLATAVEQAGFEIRDMLIWCYGTGMPKSYDLSEDPQWRGWGTGLKPSLEPILLARRPLTENSVLKNCQRWGTGGMNLQATARQREGQEGTDTSPLSGFWPGNMLYQHSPDCYHEEGRECAPGCAVGMLEAQHPGASDYFTCLDLDIEQRAIYCAKPDRHERDAGLGMPERVWKVEKKGRDVPQRRNDCLRANPHPTVKPVTLMRHLVQLVCRPGGLVLDCFCGSGTTGCAAVQAGFDFLGIEQDPEFVAVAKARIAWWAEQPMEGPVPRRPKACGPLEALWR